MRKKHVTFLVNENQKEKLDFLCDGYEMKKSELIRHLIEREHCRVNNFGLQSRVGELDYKNENLIEAACTLITAVYLGRKLNYELVIPSQETLDVVLSVLDRMGDGMARYRLVIELRYGLDGNGFKTWQQIADICGVPRERVKQIERKALRILRHPGYRKLFRETLMGQ